MTPTGPNNGQLSIEFLDYFLTRNATYYVAFSTMQGVQLTVGGVKRFLETKGRHRYQMTPEGYG
jgi:hypothetical protein